MLAANVNNQVNMATQGTFYLDSPSFSSATVVYSNAALSVVAADGFYSNGNIVRQQFQGKLLPQVNCPSCATPCGGTISASGNRGVYYLDTDLGSSTGAVVIEFNPLSIPDGIMAVYNSVIYNGVSSPNYGWLQGVPNLPTYIGNISSDCGMVANSPYSLEEFEYNGTTFASLGTNTSVSILGGQVQLTADVPGSTIMVIPKTAATPSVLNLTFIGPCSGTAFEISVSCPAALPSFASSTVNANSTLACADTIDQTYRVAHVNGGSGVLGLYDLVFTDVNGQFKLGAGFYKTTAAGTNDWYQVDANGVIIAFGTCTVSYNCVSGNCVDPGDGSGVYGTLEACEAACGTTGINVISVGGFMEPCSGGAIDDYMGATVVLDVPADVNTQFVVEVYYVETGGTCGGTQFYETFNIDILAGDDISNFDACTQGVNFPTGAVICGACIASCDNPNIVIASQFQCPS